MELPCSYIRSTVDKTGGSDYTRALTNRMSCIPFSSLGGADPHNLLFNDAYFESYVGLDKTAYQYNESTGLLSKKSLLAWRTAANNRALTQADLDALPAPPTGRILKAKSDDQVKFLSVLDSSLNRQTLQVIFDVSPKTAPVFVELVRNGRNWIAVKLSRYGQYTALVTKKTSASLTPQIISSDGHAIRGITDYISEGEGGGPGGTYVYDGVGG